MKHFSALYQAYRFSQFPCLVYGECVQRFRPLCRYSSFIFHRARITGICVAVDRPLDGKVAIVTGASSGIGAAIAAHLAEAGAKVAMAARRDDKLEELKEKLELDGGVAIAVKCDVTNRQQV